MTNRTTKMLDDITAKVTENFATFGGGKQSRVFGNPIAEAMKGKPPIFAAGVDVRDVVMFVSIEVMQHLVKMDLADMMEDNDDGGES